jgi:broad specificity phosphatase PhoE
LSETDPAKNPLLLPHVIDAPLTQKGINQCKQQYELNGNNLRGVERIIVSPLVRALQTAVFTFRDHVETIDTTIWTAHEGCREELGMLLCNKRRPLSETKIEFPHVDFSQLPHGEEDVTWSEYAGNFADSQRESTEDMSHRVYNFLEGYLRHLPEKEIAVVGHSAWLHAMCNAVLDHDEDKDGFGESLDTTMFGQAEIRTLELTFSEK